MENIPFGFALGTGAECGCCGGAGTSGNVENEEAVVLPNALVRPNASLPLPDAKGDDDAELLNGELLGLPKAEDDAKAEVFPVKGFG